MKPSHFPQANCAFAKDQPQYIPLPAHRDQDGAVTSCWRALLWERVVFLFTGRIWLRQLTFTTPLQPIRLAVLPPLFGEPPPKLEGSPSDPP
jgi:hypothetical protein